MKLLANFDLYKAVILVSLALMPFTLWWIRSTQQSLVLAEDAIYDATRPTSGHLEEIGKLQKQLRMVEDNRNVASSQTDTIQSYFGGQIFRSAKEGQLDRNQFVIGAPSEQNAMAGNNQAVKDVFVKIDWPNRGGKEFAFTRDFLFAVLFNCESSARSKESAPLPSIWKLASLKLVNATISKSFSQMLTPPEELRDEWLVQDMQFARREPRKETNR